MHECIMSVFRIFCPVTLIFIKRPYRFSHRHKVLLVVCMFLFAFFYSIVRLNAPEFSDSYKTQELLRNLQHEKEKAVNEDVVYTKSCVAQNNVVYVKSIKCASETITSVIRRYGYLRNLSFVLPPGNKIYLGWPYPIQQGFYRESKTGEYNMLCEHAVHSESLRRLMPPGTRYISSVRKPFAQFKSMFHYYNLAEIVSITSSSIPRASAKSFREYVMNMEHYEAIYKSPLGMGRKLRYCIPDSFSMTQNLMSYTLGCPFAHHKQVSLSTIDAWLDTLSRDMDLVIVVEYFVESLILLRRLLCWTWKDVLYLHQNSGSYDYKLSEDSELESVYKKWSPVDYRLYDRFNATLWHNIEKQANVKDFYAEVAAFKSTLSQVEYFCNEFPKTSSKDHENKPDLYKLVPENHWSPAFLLKKSDCELMMNSDQLLMKIKKQYDNIPVHVEQFKAPKEVC